MADPSSLTSPNPVVDTRPDKKGSLFPSIQDYYERFRNPNLFISNNANPFLISPYAPNQISQTTKNTILTTDLIQPFTPNKTIVVQGNMQMASGFTFQAGPNKPLLTERIYSATFPDAQAEAVCFSSPSPGFIVSLGTGVSNTIRFATFENTATFTNAVGGNGTYTVNVEGTVAIDSLTGGVPNALDLTTHTIPAASPVTLQGYVPVRINGAQRYVAFYSSP